MQDFSLENIKGEFFLFLLRKNIHSAKIADDVWSSGNVSNRKMWKTVCDNAPECHDSELAIYHMLS